MNAYIFAGLPAQPNIAVLAKFDLTQLGTVVARAFDIDSKDLFGGTSGKHGRPVGLSNKVQDAKCAMIYYLFLSGKTGNQIAFKLGHRSCRGIYMACAKARNLIDTDPSFSQKFQSIKTNIRQHSL